MTDFASAQDGVLRQICHSLRLCNASTYLLSNNDISVLQLRRNRSRMIRNDDRQYTPASPSLHLRHRRKEKDGTLYATKEALHSRKRKVTDGSSAKVEVSMRPT